MKTNVNFKTARKNLEKKIVCPDTGVKVSRYIVDFIVVVYKVLVFVSYFALKF